MLGASMGWISRGYPLGRWVRGNGRWCGSRIPPGLEESCSAFSRLLPSSGSPRWTQVGWPLSRRGLLKGDCGGADAEPLLSTADFPATLVFLLFCLLSGIFSPLLLPASVNCPLGQEESRQISIPSSSILSGSARTGLRDSRGGGSVSRGLVFLGNCLPCVGSVGGEGTPSLAFLLAFPLLLPLSGGGALMAMGGFSWALTRHPSQRWMSREPANGLPAFASPHAQHYAHMGGHR